MVFQIYRIESYHRGRPPAIDGRAMQCTPIYIKINMHTYHTILVAPLNNLTHKHRKVDGLINNMILYYVV